jgi:hypothetical protein
MSERNHFAVIAALVRDAESYQTELSKARRTAQEFYDGKTDVPEIEGRSRAISNDIRAAVQSALPSMVRTLLGSDDVVEFEPVGREDEESAAQASDYINDIVFMESNGHNAVHDALHDALKLRNGVLTWWWDARKEAQVSTHTGLDENSFAQLVAEKNVEVLEYSPRPAEAVEAPAVDPMAMQDPAMTGQAMPPAPPQETYDVKIKRVTEKGKIRVAAVPLDEFIIADDAVDEDSATLIGRKRVMRLTDLIAMGYDQEKVMALPKLNNGDDDDNAEKSTRKRSNTSSDESDELAEVYYYELFVRLDMDGDGISELHRMCFGGSINEQSLLDDQEWDEVDYAIGAVKRRPHQWEGDSLSDELFETARQKTVLVRQTLDNLYQQNLPQKWVQEGVIENMDAVTSLQFGKVVRIGHGSNAADAMGHYTVPFTADKSFAMLEYLDGEAQKRTGVSDHAGGLAPDALQNMTATASAMVEQMGIGQIELMARTFSHAMKRMFRGLLRLSIKHQDKARTVKLRGEWADVDPRSWNADMDCTVNTGLGAGTRERDLIAMTQVLQIQERIIQTMGPNNPFVTGPQLANTLTRMATSAGLRRPRLYFNKPKEEEVQAFLKQKADAPTPEQQKAEADMQLQMQLKQLEIASQKELAAIQADVDKNKEIVQSQAAVEERQAVAVIEAQDKEADRQLKKYEADLKAQIELLKLQQAQTLETEKIGTERERLKIDNHHKSADRAATLAGKDLVESEDGMPESASQAMIRQLIEQMNKPKRSKVRTPDGEEFVMESE